MNQTRRVITVYVPGPRWAVHTGAAHHFYETDSWTISGDAVRQPLPCATHWKPEAESLICPCGEIEWRREA